MNRKGPVLGASKEVKALAGWTGCRVGSRKNDKRGRLPVGNKVLSGRLWGTPGLHPRLGASPARCRACGQGRGCHSGVKSDTSRSSLSFLHEPPPPVEWGPVPPPQKPWRTAETTQGKPLRGSLRCSPALCAQPNPRKKVLETPSSHPDSQRTPGWSEEVWTSPGPWVWSESAQL